MIFFIKKKLYRKQNAAKYHAVCVYFLKMRCLYQMSPHVMLVNILKVICFLIVLLHRTSILGETLNNLLNMMCKLNDKLDKHFADIKETHAKDYATVQVSLDAIIDSIGSSQMNIDKEDYADFEGDIFPIQEKLDLEELEKNLITNKLYRAKLVGFL